MSVGLRKSRLGLMQFLRTNNFSYIGLAVLFLGCIRPVVVEVGRRAFIL